MEDVLEYQDFTDPSEESPVSNAESGIKCIYDIDHFLLQQSGITLCMVLISYQRGKGTMQKRVISDIHHHLNCQHEITIPPLRRSSIVVDPDNSDRRLRTKYHSDQFRPR